MEALTQALITALLAVVTTAVPIALLLFRTWANAKAVALEAATLATKATLLAEATKRAAGQVYAQMQDAAPTQAAISAVRDKASTVVTGVVAGNFGETLQQLGGSGATVAGMIEGELGRLLASAQTPPPAPSPLTFGQTP